VISAEERGAVTLVTLDRPERRNALDGQAVLDLGSALEAAIARRARVLVLRGAGGHFSAGADLKALEDERFTVALRRVLDGLAGAPLCTMAAVEGAALGAGTQLAIACDLRVATPTARFGVPAARLGLMVDAPTVERLAALVGGSVARAVLLAAEVLDGESAHRLGLVARLGGLDDALAWADEIAALAPLTVAGHKLALEHLTPRAGTSPEVAAAFARAWASADLAEGRAAFAERRPPRFRGE
jgi:enoyl-CoA hydratase